MVERSDEDPKCAALKSVLSEMVSSDTTEASKDIFGLEDSLEDTIQAVDKDHTISRGVVENDINNCISHQELMETEFAASAQSIVDAFYSNNYVPRNAHVGVLCSCVYLNSTGWYLHIWYAMAFSKAYCYLHDGFHHTCIHKCSCSGRFNVLCISVQMVLYFITTQSPLTRLGQKANMARTTVMRPRRR